MIPGERAIEQYTGDRGRHYHQSKRHIPNEAYPWVARLRAEKIQPFVLHNHTVLEYGVGYGWNLAALLCAKRIGYDVATFLGPTVAGQGIEFVTDINQVAAESLDTVICHHTLEHVLEPSVVLAAIWRILRPGGQLLVFTPYEREREFRRFNPQEPNHHLYSWNVQTLGNLLTACNFEVLGGRISRFRFDRFASVWAARLRIGERGFRCLRVCLLLLVPEFEVRMRAVRK
jgi:SAM-dependent methyltransferase